MEQVEQDPNFIALSRRFKATAMELISVLEQVKSKLKGHSKRIIGLAFSHVLNLLVSYRAEAQLLLNGYISGNGTPMQSNGMPRCSNGMQWHYTSMLNGSSWIGHIWCSWLQTQKTILTKSSFGYCHCHQIPPVPLFFSLIQSVWRSLTTRIVVFSVMRIDKHL